MAKPTYDARGNLTSDNIGGRPWAYAYDAENRLVQGTLRGATALTLSYDPAGRLRRSEGDGTTEFLYDGDRLIAEYDAAGNLVRRYVPGSAPPDSGILLSVDLRFGVRLRRCRCLCRSWELF